MSNLPIPPATATPALAENTNAPSGSAAPEPTRRALATGAAWSVPVLALGAAVPASAASLLPCPSTSCLVHNLDLPTYTVAVGTGVYGSCTNILGTPFTMYGSFVQLNLGSVYVNPSCAPAGTTGFQITFTSVSAVDQSGVTHGGTITSNCSGCAYANGAGLGGALNVGVPV